MTYLFLEREYGRGADVNARIELVGKEIKSLLGLLEMWKDNPNVAGFPNVVKGKLHISETLL